MICVSCTRIGSNIYPVDAESGICSLCTAKREDAKRAEKHRVESRQAEVDGDEHEQERKFGITASLASEVNSARLRSEARARLDAELRRMP